MEHGISLKKRVRRQHTGFAGSNGGKNIRITGQIES